MTSAHHPRLNPLDQLDQIELLNNNVAAVHPTQQREQGLGDPEGPQYCLICGDKATGKHYGAHSCDGCKGFFRRSVRKKSNYTCQYSRGCRMDKDKRNQCRYCRLKKCILVGMKRAAVQNERDRISTRRASMEEGTPSLLLSIAELMQVEQRIGLSSSNGESLPAGASMRSQLLILVSWARGLSCFSQLPVGDQLALLKAHASEILLLGVVRRSFQLEKDDVLLLGDGLMIGRHTADDQVAEVAGHILDDLFLPLRELQLDDAEFVCLKAIVFFDPTVTSGDSSRQFVRRCRYQVQESLMHHMNDKQYHKPGRFGELLLAVADLRHAACLMTTRAAFMRVAGLADVDDLLSEIVLGEHATYDLSGGCHDPLYCGPEQMVVDGLSREVDDLWRPCQGDGYGGFVNQDGIQHDQQDSGLLAGMILNSDGMPALFSSVGSGISLYQTHVTNGSAGTNFLLSLDQNFQVMGHQQQPQYGHKVNGQRLSDGLRGHEDSDSLRDQPHHPLLLHRGLEPRTHMFKAEDY